MTEPEGDGGRAGAASTRSRTAVVLIHGIGEQRPMQTLRGFARQVLPDGEYFSKADRMSELFELRRLQGAGRVTTDCYEYYWAHVAQGTKLAHLASWGRELFFRRPGNVPAHLRRLWWMAWAFALLIAAGLAWFFVAVRPTGLQLPLAVSVAAGLLIAGLTGIATSVLGDAARYLSPHPQNIDMRQRIRKNGVDLLRKLHESHRYTRIIVVGHSLGSVIGYDILKSLWPEYNAEYAAPARRKRFALPALEAVGTSLTSASTDEERGVFQRLQGLLWREQREFGSPWLVTDFITIASPLAHASLLLADGDEDLQWRKEAMELPTCPPFRQPGARHYSFARQMTDRNGQKVGMLMLDEAGLFACTRWTNIYYPVCRTFLGDLVGGPLAPYFGPGVRDVAVRPRGRLANLPFRCHTRYWKGVPVATGGTVVDGDPLEAIKAALALTWRIRTRPVSEQEVNAAMAATGEDAG